MDLNLECSEYSKKMLQRFSRTKILPRQGNTAIDKTQYLVCGQLKLQRHQSQLLGHSKDLLNQIYLSDTKQSFLEKFRQISTDLDKTVQQLQQETHTLTFQDYIRVGVIDCQISTLLFSHAQDIEFETLASLLKSSFELDLLHTQTQFEYLISRTASLSKYTMDQTVSLIEIISKMRKKIKQRSEIDYLFLVEKIYFQLLADLEGNYKELMSKNGSNKNVLQSLLRAEQMREINFREVELTWFNSRLQQKVKNGTLKQEFVKTAEDTQIYLSLVATLKK